MKARPARYLFILLLAIIALVGGCTGTPSSSLQVDAPRYQMQVVRDQAYAYVYRLDTATGEIEAFLITSPEFVERISREGANALKRLHGGMTFSAGPTLPGKRK